MSDNYSYYNNLERDMDHIKHTLFCIAVGCYFNIVLSFCILL